MNAPLLAYYGDDFTGSTDALECLTQAGLRAVLFTRPPTTAVLQQYDGLQAIGVAGITRSLPPEAMVAELEPVLTSLQELKPRHVHYKVCSTFDSSPSVGSIGCAIETGKQVFQSRYVPLVVGAPALGRYCAFGNLFATEGVGTAGEAYRLDRHASASCHPTTPMTESDLRLHLAKQTQAKIAIYDLLKFERSEQSRREALSQLVGQGTEVILFDTVTDRHLELVGQLVEEGARSGEAPFTVGSSGVEMALCSHWAAKGELNSRGTWDAPGRASQVLVVSGSCSPVTESQIQWAAQHGVAEVAIDTPAVVTDGQSHKTLDRALHEIVDLLKSGRSVVAHTSKGNSDRRLVATTDALAKCNPNGQSNQRSASVLGAAMGRLVRNALDETKVRRVCIAGGDTSSYLARELDIETLEMISPLAPGVPICRATAPNSPADGIEISFKGGQVGRESFFGSLLNGTL